MSRTVRRKNFKRSLLRNSECSKKFGFYAKRIVVNGKLTYRAPTKAEIYEDNKYFHGESRDSNARTPSRWYRQQRENMLRTHNKRELLNALNREDYEMGVIYHKPSSHLWDWS